MSALEDVYQIIFPSDKNVNKQWQSGWTNYGNPHHGVFSWLKYCWVQHMQKCVYNPILRQLKHTLIYVCTDNKLICLHMVMSIKKNKRSSSALLICWQTVDGWSGWEWRKYKIQEIKYIMSHLYKVLCVCTCVSLNIFFN